MTTENQTSVAVASAPVQSESSANTPVDSVYSVQGFEHAQRVAKAFSSSNLVPKEYQNNIPNTLIAMEMAQRIGATPLMVMQNLNIIHGKPSWSSTFIISAINSCGRFAPLRFTMDGEGDQYGCTAWTYGKDGEKLSGPKVTLEMVKAEGWLSKPNSKWKTMPELMFRYRAAAFFGRLYAPDILMGMHTIEETLDMPATVLTEQINKEELIALFEEKRPLLNEQDLADATRIIENNEKANYSKLMDKLKTA